MKDMHTLITEAVDLMKQWQPENTAAIESIAAAEHDPVYTENAQAHQQFEIFVDILRKTVAEQTQQ